MTDLEKTRIIAWSNELRQVHARLQEAVNVARAAAQDDDAEHDHAEPLRL